MGIGTKRASSLTAVEVAHLAPGVWLSDRSPGRGGKLLARGLQDGSAMFYFRYAPSPGKRDTIPLGTFSRDGRKGLSLDAARTKAAVLRQRYQSGDRDLRAVLERERADALQADDKQSSRTLGALLTAYADQLESGGKPSAKSVRAELFHHVREAWPILWATPIANVTTDDLLGVVARPVEDGHKRQAEKVRAYLRAAFAAGMRARHDAGALPTLRALRISANPARDLTPIAGANRARDRALSLKELRAYWKRILNEPEHAMLRFHLLTGCQRVQQLGRATVDDYDPDTKTVRLLDPKGRRAVPRAHFVPVLPAALKSMRAMRGGTFGPYLVTVTAGESGITHHTLGDRITAISAAMLAKDELPGGPFSATDLRRTVETRLADAGVSRDVRAHLQSHGLGGVQARHYDRADYLTQTRAALQTLARMLIK